MHQRNMYRTTIITLALFAVVMVLAASFAPQEATDNFSPTLTVYFFDVDQGDAILFLAADFTMLIDAGRHDRSDVVPYLRSVGVETIDLFVGTHPHSDHIGQCEQVMKAFPVREVWLSGDVHTTRTFERCIDAILASDAGYHEPRAGETFQLGSARIEILHPSEVTGDFNNGSISMRVIYGDVIFMLTGDAEAEAEQAMLDRNLPLNAHIIKLGHHGSRTSSTLSFLAAVKPEVAIYSAGVDNPYGHPHPEVVQRIASLGIPLYGTDTHGTIRILTDGKEYRVLTERDHPVSVQPQNIPNLCAPGQINVNAASISELTQIVHIGPVIAERIVAERPFLSLDDLTRVSGLGASRVRDIQAQGLACIGPMQ